MTHKTFISKVLIPVIGFALIFYMAQSRFDIPFIKEFALLFMAFTLFVGAVGYFFVKEMGFLELTFYTVGVYFTVQILQGFFWADFQLLDFSVYLSGFIVRTGVVLAISLILYLMRNILGWRFKEEPKPKEPKSFGHKN